MKRFGMSARCQDAKLGRLTLAHVPDQVSDTVVRVEEEWQGDDEFAGSLQPYGEIYGGAGQWMSSRKLGICLPWMAEMTCAESMAGNTGWSR